MTFSILETNNGKQNSKYDETDKVCPSCKKGLSNNKLLYCMSYNFTSFVSIFISSIVMKPCSHVVCKTCFDSLVQQGEQCVVCEKKLKKTDMLQLNREGVLLFDIIVTKPNL